MNCVYHPETTAPAVCECGAHLCPECADRLPGPGCSRCVARKRSQELGKVGTDLAAAVAGAVAGAAVFYALTRSFAETGGWMAFAAAGAGWPFGWRALRPFPALATQYSAWGGNVVLVLLILALPLIKLVLKMWFALVIGLPALAVTAGRRAVVLLRLHAAARVMPGT